jgi:hypothetical protein
MFSEPRCQGSGPAFWRTYYKKVWFYHSSLALFKENVLKIPVFLYNHTKSNTFQIIRLVLVAIAAPAGPNNGTKIKLRTTLATAAIATPLAV